MAIRLIAGLGNVDTEALDYRFAAKIDFNGFIPTQRIEETGQINLNSKGVYVDMHDGTSMGGQVLAAERPCFEHRVFDFLADGDSTAAVGSRFLSTRVEFPSIWGIADPSGDMCSYETTLYDSRRRLPDGDYSQWSGGAMANAHGAGAVALVVTALPALAGDPDAIDSIVPMAYGNLALDLILKGIHGRLVVLRNGRYDNVPIDVVTSRKKTLDVKKFYHHERLRPTYERFEGAPVFIMTSDY